MSRSWQLVALLSLFFGLPTMSQAADVSGDLKRWHTVTIDFAGPSHNEMDSSPNPFLDYRLQVLLTSPGGGTVYSVPGFFDGDGIGGATGSVWRVRFTPDAAGTWTYEASFRSGTNIAVDLDPGAGSPVFFDGESGSFTVTGLDPSADGFRKYGRLESIGGFYLKFRDGGYWAKLGTNNPENFLGYEGFDNTPNAWHSYSNHVTDWNVGDPDWDSPDNPGTHDGRGIIGALNYLAELSLNSIYFMPMNIGADGKDTWPYADPSIDRNGSSANDNLHFDISKLTQWEIVFDHAQRQELFLHWVLSDKTAANKNELDNATLGVERKLFYREMVARFAHHNAMQWNICEEYNLTLPLDPAVIKQFGEFIDDIDPYDHPITVHPHGNTYANALEPFLGDHWFKIMSVQTWQRPEDIGYAIEYFWEETTDAGNPVPVMLDESIGMNQLSVAEYRKRTFWDALFSGGGFEMFKSHGDSGVDDFHVYEDYFEDAQIALEFVEDNLPFWTMEPADDLVTGENEAGGGAEVFAVAGDVYAIYLPDASSSPTLSLASVSGTFDQQWFNPRSGQFEGTPAVVSGGSAVNLGAPPSSASEDWVVLLRNTSFPPVLENGQPSGILPPGTTQTTISVDTDVESDCRYHTIPGTDYDVMPFDFDVTGGASHSSTVSGLVDGQAFSFYVRCAKPDGVYNPSDYVISFIVASSSGAPIGDKAVWYLDEGLGSVTGDSSGQGNTGTLIDDPQWVAGRSGQALRFDGVDDWVSIADSPGLDFSTWAGASIAMWVRPERLDHRDDQTLFGHWRGSHDERPFQIMITASNQLQCRSNDTDGEVTSSLEVAVDVWTHVVCVWSPTGLLIYVNGEFDRTDNTVEGALDDSDGLHTLGTREKDGAQSQFFMGTLDEIHVFSRDLTATEVASLFTAFHCIDADGDGTRICDGDCDDTNPHCDTACTDGDADGYCTNHDCDETNPDCTFDCTDGDSDGICASHDCDDTTPSVGLTVFGEALIAPDRDALEWTAAADVRWRIGDLVDVGGYATLSAGSLYGATSLDISMHLPDPGNGIYVLVRDQGCGSWQFELGEQPGPDAGLPLP